MIRAPRTFRTFSVATAHFQDRFTCSRTSAILGIRNYSKIVQLNQRKTELPAQYCYHSNLVLDSFISCKLRIRWMGRKTLALNTMPLTVLTPRFGGCGGGRRPGGGGGGEGGGAKHVQIYTKQKFELEYNSAKRNTSVFY